MSAWVGRTESDAKWLYQTLKVDGWQRKKDERLGWNKENMMEIQSDEAAKGRKKVLEDWKPSICECYVLQEKGAENFLVILSYPIL